MIDTHSHLYVEEFDCDRAQAVERALQAGVEKIFLPNIDKASIAPMMDMVRKWPGVCYPMIGLHPTEVFDSYLADLNYMQRLLETPHPFIAIGEVGLDFYWDKTYMQQQLEAFDRQIRWSIRYGLPLMIHVRAAHRELIDALLPYKDKGIQGVFHSFGGTADEAHELLQFENFMLGINGVVTFKKSRLPEVLKEIPLKRIVVETDCPYLTPVPFRGKRNESAYVRYTLNCLSHLYDLSVEKVDEVTRENALSIFKLAR